MILELLITLSIGIMLIIMGVLLWRKQKISLLHDYHYKNVQEKDIKSYTKMMGIGLLIIGICTISTGLVDFFFRTIIGWLIFVIGLVSGIIILNYAQKKYNGGLFS